MTDKNKILERRKNILKQYFTTAETMVDEPVLKNIESFSKQFFNEQNINILGLWFSSDNILVNFQLLEKNTIQTTSVIPIDDFVNWLTSVTNIDVVED